LRSIIIDDDDSARFLVKHIANKIDEESIDLVFLDVHMPNLLVLISSKH